MEKFKKLSRAEMRSLIGGVQLCSPDDYVNCTCNGTPDPCVSVGDWSSSCAATWEVCDAFCAAWGLDSIGGNSACYTTDICNTPDTAVNCI